MFSFPKKLFIGAIIIASTFGFGGVPTAKADGYSEIASQGIIFAGICPAGGGPTGDCQCRDNGNCTLNDVLQVFINISTFILGITGSAVLFVFIYGGFKWLLSRGDSKWVTAGKDAMTGGVIGLVIIFGSYVSINFIVSGLTTPPGETPATGPLETTATQGATQDGMPIIVTPVFTTE